MIVDASQLNSLLEKSKQRISSSFDKVWVVFVANGDVDSLCTVAQLETLLGRSDTAILVEPVENYEDIRRGCEAQGLHEAQEERVLVLINCGATESIKDICGLSYAVRVLIIDSHRPIFHGHKQHHDFDGVGGVFVVLADDDPVPKRSIPDYIEACEAEEEEEDDGSMDDSGDEEGDDVSSMGGRDQGDPSSSSPMRSPGDRPNKRQKRAEGAQQRRRERAAYQQQVDEYYLTMSGYGKPSAMLMFNAFYMSQQENSFSIWLAIMGLTDQAIHQRISPDNYKKWTRDMEENLSTLNGVLTDMDNGGHTNNTARQKMTVQKINGALRIPLLRHWTLRDAVMHTHHVATRLCTWRDTGKKQVDLLLAACNVRRPHCEEAFSTMHRVHLDRLDEKFLEKASAYGLSKETLKYEGFELQFKNDFKITALDYVLALTALLGKQRTETHNSKAIFREAVDALYPHRDQGIAQLRPALEHAKGLAVRVVEEGGLLVTRRQVQGGKHDPCWYLDLSNMMFQSSKDFHHHSTLVRLALFVRDAWAQRVKAAQSLVVIGPPDEHGMCHVVAVRKGQQAGGHQNNPLAIPFQEVLAEHTSEEVSQATFDNTVYTIKRSHVYTFVEELRSLIRSYQEGGDTEARLAAAAL